MGLRCNKDTDTDFRFLICYCEERSEDGNTINFEDMLCDLEYPPAQCTLPRLKSQILTLWLWSMEQIRAERIAMC